MSPSDNSAAEGRGGEDEPLLGGPGDASQQPGQSIWYNLILGTAPIAQAGIWILTATVWASVFLHPVILFSAHPLLNSAGILLVTQAILIIQPTQTPEQKREGAHIHAILNGIGVLAIIGGLIIIEYNKISGGHPHFGTPHNIIGLIVSIAFIIQALVGIAQFYIPGLFGGINNAKAIYKYHRASGYVILLLAFAAVATATQTAYNKTLGIQLWVVIVASLITIVGIFPRIKKSKFGF